MVGDDGYWVGGEDTFFVYISPRERQMYALYVYMYSDYATEIKKNDGGISSWRYEFGPLVSYCMRNYSESGAEYNHEGPQNCKGGD